MNKEKIIKRGLLGIGLVVICSLFVFAIKVKNNNGKTNIDGKIESINFAGEATPLHDSEVAERLDREMITNRNYHSSTTLILKRANRAFPVIEPILKEYGVPDDFKYLAVAESALANAVSSAGARGYWQFMTATAKEKGLIVNTYVDERYHLVKSTQAACKYLLEAKEKFGTWTLAAASYNAGMAGIHGQLTRQEVESYYDLLLNEETSRYVFRILALKEIMQNPTKYNFNFPQEELYPILKTKTIQATEDIDDLVIFAKNNGINYKILKTHNPWLRDKMLKVYDGQEFFIEIPTEGYNK